MLKALNVLLLSMLLFMLSCQKNKGNTTNNSSFSDCGSIRPVTPLSMPTDTVGATVQIDSLPLSIGNMWTYSVVEQAYNVCGELYNDTFSFTIIVDSIIVRNGMMFGHVSSTYDHMTAGSYDYFSVIYFCSAYPSCYLTNLGNGLHQLNNLANTDSGYVADSSAYLINTTGVGWNSKESVDSTLQSVVMRQWAGYVKVTTPAGVYNCKKMKVTDDSDQLRFGVWGMATAQYFSSKGLVQEVQQGKGASLGPGTGPVTVTRVITLTAVNF